MRKTAFCNAPGMSLKIKYIQTAPANAWLQIESGRKAPICTVYVTIRKTIGRFLVKNRFISRKRRIFSR